MEHLSTHYKLDHKASLKKLQGIGIIQCMFPGHNKIKLEINKES